MIKTVTFITVAVSRFDIIINYMLVIFRKEKNIRSRIYI